MQTLSNYISPVVPASYGSEDQLNLKVSVVHLLARAYMLPCTTAAEAFMELVQPTARFQLALDALLPLLDTPAETAQRILVSYILYSLYAPHPIAINPFKSALQLTFIRERDRAVQAGNGEDEQLVWVLWKILRGDGNDIGPYSPATLAGSPLPPRLRASNLTLDDEAQDGSSQTENVAINDQPENPSKTRQLTSSNRDQQNQAVGRALQLLLDARQRVLTLAEQRAVIPLIPEITPLISSLDLPPIIACNPNIAQPLFISLVVHNASTGGSRPTMSTCLDVLMHLPPTLPSLDLMGRLLRDATPIPGWRTTIAEVVRREVLGRFLHGCIEWLDNAEEEEREGLISDDRFSQGVQNLCRFYTSLLKLSVVDLSSDAEFTEMAHFSLRNSRFEEANVLYRMITAARF